MKDVLLAQMDLRKCAYRGRVLDPLEPDQSIERDTDMRRLKPPSFALSGGVFIHHYRRPGRNSVQTAYPPCLCAPRASLREVY